MDKKKATPDRPIHSLLSERWSPYGFAERPVEQADLASLFEAARWAASSYNEQPWSYIVATRANENEFARLLACLIDANQAWARFAPVLALGVISRQFARNGKENRAAAHDLGLASGNLLVEATARGLFVHQMIGIHPEKARELYQIPDHHEAFTALAIGYEGVSPGLPDGMKARDLAPRQRKPLSQFVFTGKWGAPIDL